jgi:putative flavoprotein involved in K+ transport
MAEACRAEVKESRAYQRGATNIKSRPTAAHAESASRWWIGKIPRRMTEQINTVVVGGGQAGLSMSYHLSRLGCPHVILERARIGESWRSERWDSLMFQFPNWAIRLGGYGYQSDDPNGFVHKDEVVRFLEHYARLIKSPVRCGVRVRAVRQRPRSARFLVESNDGLLEADNVVAATGSYHDPLIPRSHTELPRSIMQVHSSAYRNPQQLPPGAVLVVGGGASGVQIAQELNESGRKVYLSIGRYRRTPRTYRGRDLYWWFSALNIWDRSVEQYPDLKRGPLLLVSGVGGGRDIDLRRFTDDGITLLGRMCDIVVGKISFADDLEQTLMRGEAWFADLRIQMDEYARAHGLVLPEEPPPKPPSHRAATSILELDASATGITAVVWASGFRYDFDWVKLPVLDASGEPLQQRGVSPCPGFYFLGLRRMFNLRSSLFEGVGEDAAYVSAHIAARYEEREPRAVA